MGTTAKPPITDMTLYIHWTKTHARGIDRKHCPDCKRDSFIAWFHQEWYGVDQTCLRCGRQWQDGEWCPLAFYRHARRDNIRAAKKRWRRGLAEPD